MVWRRQMTRIITKRIALPKIVGSFVALAFALALHRIASHRTVSNGMAHGVVLRGAPTAWYEHAVFDYNCSRLLPMTAGVSNRLAT